MKRLFCCAVLALSVLPLAAQAPEGWKLRADRSTNASDPDAPGPIRFTKSGSGFQAVTPQAAVFWHPSNTIAGNYSLKGTFTLVKPSNHLNYYGVVFGGGQLDGAAQSYLYFMVAQDGSWMIKRRTGEATTEVAKAVHAAVKKPDANGTSTNVVEVRVGADKIDYIVNGTVVHTTPKTGMTTDGLYGIRVNHQLEVKIDGLSASKLS